VAGNVRVVEDKMLPGVAVGTNLILDDGREDVSVAEATARNLLRRRKGRKGCPEEDADNDYSGRSDVLLIHPLVELFIPTFPLHTRRRTTHCTIMVQNIACPS